MRPDSSPLSQPPPATPQLSVQETVAAHALAARGGPGSPEPLTRLLSAIFVLTFVVIIAGCFLAVVATDRWDTTDSSPDQLKTYAVAFLPLLAFVPAARALDGRLRRKASDRRRALRTWFEFAGMLLAATAVIFVATSVYVGLNSMVF
ncbi:MAG: hypothetical protein Q7T55_23290 [Solirubrobacteraceae bacterium]|nr:hypothetical protein [Solirubrobacteraceae bacterium]